ncbi:MAG: hypothetical protein JXR95_05955 [Deltaproteobacteria bacterium]|nr:hypothetical protein [Deltaproteobacteria bacterium]
MKNYLTVILILMLSYSGCSKKGDPENEKSSEIKKVPQKKENTPSEKKLHERPTDKEETKSLEDPSAVMEAPGGKLTDTIKATGAGDSTAVKQMNLRSFKKKEDKKKPKIPGRNGVSGLDIRPVLKRPPSRSDADQSRDSTVKKIKKITGKGKGDYRTSGHRNDMEGTEEIQD